MGIGPITDVTEWPSPLQSALEDNPKAQESVRVFSLSHLIDRITIWHIQNNSALVARLIEENDLELVTPQHPMADELFDSIPRHWPRPTRQQSTYHATPDFGTYHIEGIDLLLVVSDAEQKRAIVLHHWNF